jgi:mRNA interferase YafQ
MSIKILSTNKFDKQLKLMLKRGKDREKLNKFLTLINEGVKKGFEYHLLLPEKYHLHKLLGNYDSLWECHIEPDWLLIFSLNNGFLTLESTGTHSDLFK